MTVGPRHSGRSDLKLYLGVACIAIFGSAASDFAAEESPAITHYRAGYELLQARNYRNAAIELEQALAADSTYVNAHYALGKAYAVLNDHAKAIRSLEAAGRHGMDIGRISVQLGKLYHKEALRLYRERKFKEAIERFDSSLTHSPDNARALYVKGLSYSRLRDDQAAAAAFQQAIAIDPSYAKPYKALGDINRRSRNFGAAADYYNKAIAADGNFMEAYGGLAQVHLASDDFEAAVTLLEAALKLDPNYANGYVYLGTGLNRLGRHNLAIEPLRKATDLSANNAEAHYLLAEAYYGKADYQYAYDAGKQALRHKRDYHAAEMILGDICSKMGKVDEARSWYTRAMKDSRLKDYCKSRIEELDRPQP